MKEVTRQDYLERIRRVLRFVQEHLDEPLPPDRLAREAILSTFHFHRVFSGLVGESLSEHVRRLRLERAAGELRRTDRPVVDIALGAGYDAHEPFTRAFRSHFGMPPAVFRKSAGALVFPRALCGVHYGVDEAVSRFVPLQEDTRMIEVRLDTLPARRLLAIAHHGDYQKIGDAFGRIMAIAGKEGLLGPNTQSVGVYFNDPDVTPESELRSAAGITVPHDFADVPEGCELIDLPGGEHAIGVHRGPYRELHGSYQWLFSQWLPSSGREAADAPASEIYVNDPQQTPEIELITHICVQLVPVEKAVSS